MFGNGGTLKFGTTQTVSELTNITGPGYAADSLDNTTHDNNDRFRTFIKGLIDAGAFSVEGLLKNENFDILEGIAATTTIQSVTVTMPTEPSVSQFEVNGFIENLELSDPFDDLMEFSCDIKISGKPTYSKI